MELTPATDVSWDCSAYGPSLRGQCFFAASQPCTSAQVCDERLVTERQRLFRRIQEKSAHDPDPLWAHVAAEFTTPEELLGGEDTVPDLD